LKGGKTLSGTVNSNATGAYEIDLDLFTGETYEVDMVIESVGYKTQN